MTNNTNMVPPQDLSGREILMCVCGGIAAYKVCAAVSELVQRGAGVTVAMTRAARKFVGPMTFQALSGRPVVASLWTRDTPYEAQHIGATEQAHLVVVAPATANVIGKLASGIADDVVTTLVMSAVSPVLVVPAMNNRMWANPIVSANVRKLTDASYAMLGPAEGWLACRSTGPGRMVEAADIVARIAEMLRADLPRE